ncbi:MAG: tetratricopeptide repeat protein, partial [Puniceicoccales bacterium]|nr:tetratricopeptide repeat protein [Puniceicoccales bacterium]
MVRAFSRIQRLSASLAVILVALAVTNPPASYAQAQQAGQTERKKSPQELLAEKAERNFVERKYEEALASYQELLTKSGSAMLEEQRAFLQLRIASCHFYLKKWENAEKGLLEFLDTKKYPNGTGDIIDPQNNFRGAAQITLADVYSRQKKWDAAIDVLQRISRSTDIRMDDRTRATVALTRMLEGKAKDAGGDAVKKAAEQSIEIIKPLLSTRNYALPEIKEAANRLVELYTKAGLVKEARALQDEMSAQISGSPLDVAVANFQRIEMGDSLFEQAENEGDPDRRIQLYRSALTSYQETLRRNSISHLIDKAVEMKNAEVEAIKTRYTNPTEEQQNQIAKVAADRDAFVKITENFKKNNDYDAFISYRIGLCLLELKRPWEAYIAFKDIFDTNPNFSRASTATYYYIHTLKTIHRNKEAQALCRDFLQKYPHAEETGDVAVLLGEISFEEDDYNEAVKQFRWARDNVKSLKLEYKEWIDWYIAAALFANVDWKDAQEAIVSFISKYPKSTQLEQMYYMRALCYFYQGLYKETLAGFDDYLSKYPNGQFRPDARYRLAVVTFGLKPNNDKDAQEKINDVVKRCNEWLTDYENPPAAIAQAILRQRPEIYTLLADVYIRLYEDKSKANTPELKLKNVTKAVDYYILAAK